MEVEIHRRAYGARPGTEAVLHCQSRAATLLACHREPPASLDFIPEVPAYVRRHAYVPYHNPGSSELAGAVCGALEDPEVTVVQMTNHGQIIIGAGPEEVVRRATFFELACWMAAQGLPLGTIAEEDVRALRDYGRGA
jgi:L-fuculose-phosphate aldolase